MKILERNILSFQEQDFFRPVREKLDYIRLLMLGARQVLLNTDIEGASPTSKMKLVVDKMSRLFFYRKQKYFSVAFPFTVTIHDSQLIEFATFNGRILDNKTISAVIAILDSPEFRLNPSLIDYYIEPTGIEPSGLFLLEEIFLVEPSYIRYDCDLENENGKLHPLNHIDINYSQYSTFKLGLNSNLTEDRFENIQNTKTECSFIID